MPPRVVQVCVDDAQWTSFDIPGGSAPVEVCVLREEEDTRARTLFVRFPPAWQRAATGSYSCDEELVVIDGTIEMSGCIYAPREWALIPAGYSRRGTSTPSGAIALARFGGPARWTSGDSGRDVTVPRRLVEFELPGAPGTPAAEDVELFSFDDRTWRWVPKGEGLPEISGCVFHRGFGSRGGTP